MKVTGNNGINIAKIYSDNKLKASREKEKVNKKYDSIEISKEGMGIAKYVSIAKTIPDVRAEKVDDIKSRIQSGDYKVSSEELASKIIEAADKE
jgi:negative regulator of flagellin synthesis FlgM